MDTMAKLRAEIGRVFTTRPIQMSGYIIGIVLAVAFVTYATFSSVDNRQQINNIKESICVIGNNTPSNTQICQQAFNQLLENPTPEQAERLREIVKFQ